MDENQKEAQRHDLSLPPDPASLVYSSPNSEVLDSLRPRRSMSSSALYNTVHFTEADPEDPKNWPGGRKASIVASLCCLSFCAYVAPMPIFILK